MILESLRSLLVTTGRISCVERPPTDTLLAHGDAALEDARTDDSVPWRSRGLAGAVGGGALPGITCAFLSLVAPPEGLSKAALMEHLFFERLARGQLMGCVAAGAVIGTQVARAERGGASALGAQAFEHLMGAAVGGCMMGIAASAVGMMVGMLWCDSSASQPISPYVVGLVSCTGVGTLFHGAAARLLVGAPLLDAEATL